MLGSFCHKYWAGPVRGRVLAHLIRSGLWLKQGIPKFDHKPVLLPRAESPIDLENLNFLSTCIKRTLINVR
jgi:hypothetical protein